MGWSRPASAGRAEPLDCSAKIWEPVITGSGIIFVDNEALTALATIMSPTRELEKLYTYSS